MALPARLEVLLEEIRDALLKQAESADGVSTYLGMIAGELEEFNKTLKAIKAYLAQLAAQQR